MQLPKSYEVPSMILDCGWWLKVVIGPSLPVLLGAMIGSKLAKFDWNMIEGQTFFPRYLYIFTIFLIYAELE